MVTMITGMFRPRTPPPDVELRCPVCNTYTKLNVGYAVKCRLDCLTCIQTDGVSVVVTEFVRPSNTDPDDNIKEVFSPVFTKMHFKLPNSDTSYVWKWVFPEQKTILYKVDKECAAPDVHVFDEIMDINLTNYISKTKMCLLFG